MSIFPRTGGKNGQIAEAIAFAIPSTDIETYIEPYGGSFGVGVHNMCPYPTEIYNDLDPFCYATMKGFTMDGMGLLEKMYRETEYSRDYFETAKNIVLSRFAGVSDPMERAKYAYFALLASFNGNCRRFKGIRSGFEELAYRQGLLHKLELVERMKNVVVLKEDALELISKHKDCASTLIYLDPPYTKNDAKHNITSSRRTKRDLYIYDMETPAQIELLQLLQSSKAKIILSGYRNSLYDSELTPAKGWCCWELMDVVKTMSASKPFDLRQWETELIWTNYPVFSIK